MQLIISTASVELCVVCQGLKELTSVVNDYGRHDTHCQHSVKKVHVCAYITYNIALIAVSEEWHIKRLYQSLLEISTSNSNTLLLFVAYLLKVTKTKLHN